MDAEAHIKGLENPKEYKKVRLNLGGGNLE